MTTIQYGDAMLTTRERYAENVRAWATFLENASTDTTDPAIARLQADAQALASEHGHELGPWYQSERLTTAAICTGCHVSVCLRIEGFGSNADPLRWLREHGPCVRARFYVVKSGRGYFVRDRERPGYAARAMGTRAKCSAVAQRLNAEQAPAAPVDVDELVKARAKVERARKALARAEAALSALEARAVDCACEAPNVAQALLAACEPDGSLNERVGGMVVAHFSAISSGPLRPLARAGSGFVKGKRGKR